MKFDVLIIGYAVNQNSGGYSNKQYTFLETVSAKYLHNNCFLDTYCAEPMPFMQLAAQLEKENFSVHIIDGLLLGYDKETLYKEICKINTDIYCFSLYDSTKEDIYELIHMVKERNENAKIVLGGPYVTIASNEIMAENKEVDFVTVGDADFALPNLVKCLKNNGDLSSVFNLYYREDNKIIKNKAVCVDLDETERPKRVYVDEIKNLGFSMSISSSRGCGYANCSFCYLSKYQEISGQPKHRFKSPEILVDEIKDLVEKYQINKLSFCDEDFFGGKAGVERAIKVFNLLVERGIILNLHVNARVKTVIWLAKNGYLQLCSDAGVRYMFVGLESYNDDALKRYDKGINTADIDYVISELEKYNIMINPGLITFDPLLTIHDVKANIDLYKRIHYYDAFMFTRRLVVYPNAKEKIQKLVSNKSYFCDKDTKVLYELMSKYRDSVFPYYMILNKDLVSNKVKQIIENFHFDCFYQTYEMINNSKYEEADTFVKEAANTTIKYINSLLESVYE